MNVYAVTVTYGNRSGFVERLAERLMAVNVYKLIVVDNGSVPECKLRLKDLADAYPSKVEVISLAENTGSAGGFKTGLMAAGDRPDCDYIWLLDDDNLPDLNASDQLLVTYQNLNENCCLVSLRKDRILYRRIFNDSDVKRKFTSNNSFIHYNILHWFRKRFLYSWKKFNLISIPYAPYGGMFFHKRLLQTIGYPLDQMYLYRDDHEYSHRIIKAGLKIYLHRESIIKDMEVSWHGRKKYRLFRRFMTVVDGEEMKTYFLIRNSIFLESKCFVTNQWEYTINRFLYTVIFYALCILSNKPDRIKLFQKAFADSKKMNESLDQVPIN
jgi:GT2 family glycosyltransferase